MFILLGRRKISFKRQCPPGIALFPALSDLIPEIRLQQLADFFSGATDFYSGAVEIYSGAVDIYSGAADFFTGAVDIFTGAAEIYSGAPEAETKSKTGALQCIVSTTFGLSCSLIV